MASKKKNAKKTPEKKASKRKPAKARGKASVPGTQVVVVRAPAPKPAKKKPAKRAKSIQEARAERLMRRAAGCSTAGADLAMCRWG